MCRKDLKVKVKAEVLTQLLYSSQSNKVQVVNVLKVSKLNVPSEEHFCCTKLTFVACVVINFKSM